MNDRIKQKMKLKSMGPNEINNLILSHILDDIEFGYDIAMIKSKILRGNYDVGES